MSREAAAGLVLDLAQDRPPTLGRTRLVCVDGGAGSGKTTLAGAVAAAAGGTVAVVHMDDLYDGWGGLDRGLAPRVRRELLDPLAEGRPARYRRYDWHRGRFAEERPVPVVDLLVLEGVGSGAAAHAALTTLLVWVDAPAALRLRRGLARDGAPLLPQWSAWLAAEERWFARERTRERADVVLDGAAGWAVRRRPDR